MNLIDRLAALGEMELSEISGSNPPSQYLPIRSKNNAIHYDAVAGNVLGLLIGKRLIISTQKFRKYKSC